MYHIVQAVHQVSIVAQQHVHVAQFRILLECVLLDVLQRLGQCHLLQLCQGSHGGSLQRVDGGILQRCQVLGSGVVVEPAFHVGYASEVILRGGGMAGEGAERVVVVEHTLRDEVGALQVDGVCTVAQVIVVE